MRGTRCCGVLVSPTPQTQTKKKKSMFPKFGKSKKKADAADAPPPVPEAEPAKAPTPPPPGMREDATPIPVLSESLGKASLGEAERAPPPSLRAVAGVGSRDVIAEPEYVECQPAGLTVRNSPLKTEELGADKAVPPAFKDAWDDGVGAHFNVRVGPNYKKTGKKLPSGPALYEACAAPRASPSPFHTP